MTSSAFDVVVCGSLHLDIVVRSASLPRLDETAVGRSWQRVCGGKGGNQAVAAASAGAGTAMIGRVGEDEFGQSLLAHLHGNAVDCSQVLPVSSAGSGMSVTILQDDGNYGAVIVSGANLSMDGPAAESQWRTCGGATVLLLQNEIPEAANAAIAAEAHKAGALVVHNAAPARPLDKHLAANTDVLVVNRVEAEALSGLKVQDPASAEAAAAGLLPFSPNVVVTLGGEGLVVATREGLVTRIAPYPVKVVSTHGAGDWFCGTLAAALAKGASLVEACRQANADASAFVAGQRLRRG